MQIWYLFCTESTVLWVQLLAEIKFNEIPRYALNTSLTATIDRFPWYPISLCKNRQCSRLSFHKPDPIVLSYKHYVQSIFFDQIIIHDRCLAIWNVNARLKIECSPSIEVRKNYQFQRLPDRFQRKCFFQQSFKASIATKWWIKNRWRVDCQNHGATHWKFWLALFIITESISFEHILESCLCFPGLITLKPSDSKKYCNGFIRFFLLSWSSSSDFINSAHSV